MRPKFLTSIVAGVSLLSVTASADVRVTIADGKVSISAKDATTRQILTEWARVGQTKIVNIERVSGAPVTLELNNVPEAQALDTLLRSTGGYLAAPRAVTTPSTSRYDRIFLMTAGGGSAPNLAAPRPVQGAPASQPTFVQAPVFLPPDNAADEDEPAPAPAPVSVPRGTPVAPPGNSPRPTVFSTFPPDQPAEEPRQRPAAAPPAAPAAAGVARPGMVVPAPPQPDQDQNGRNRR